MKISIVIPFYNEEKHITSVLQGLKKYGLHIILVDDGSTDHSSEKISDLKLKNIDLLKHRINLGKGAAMKTGADYAFANGAEAIIFMDSDNQHKPEDLHSFTKVLESGKYDVVLGSRNYSYGVPLVRFLGNKFASVILTVFFGIYVSDVLCGFRALTKNAYQKIRWDSTGYGVETEMIARLGKIKLNFCEVPVESIYHDKNKGVTMLDAIGILGELVKWKFTI